MTKQHGLTLLELLVAVALLAVVSALGFASLTSVRDAAAGAETSLERLRVLQLGVSLLERDLEAATGRSIADGLAGQADAFIGSRQAFSMTTAAASGFDMTRRSGLRRVRYVLDGADLKRQVWPVLDRPATGSRPAERVVFAGLSDFSVRFYDEAGQVYETWSGASTQVLPRAVELSIALPAVGTVRRLVVLE